MRTQTRSSLAALIALAVVPAALRAQAAGSLPAVTELPASVRAMALGNAYMMNAGHADALFYHPALLTGAGGFGIELQRWSTRSTSAAVSAATQWLGGGVGIGMQTLQYDGPGTGEAAAPAGQDHLFEAGSTAVSERVLTVGYAREIFGVDVGIAGKLVEERIAPASETSAMFDLGAARDVGPVRVGLTVRDLGPDPIVADEPWTPRVALGAGSYGRPLWIFDVGVTAEAEWSEDRTTVSGGVEIGYWPVQGRTFVGRIGVQDPIEGSDMCPFSFGFAYWGDDVTVEWAFRRYRGDASPGTHRFGFRLR